MKLCLLLALGLLTCQPDVASARIALGDLQSPGEVSLSFSQDGESLVASGRIAVTVWDLRRGERRWSAALAPYLEGAFGPAAFSDDGAHLAVGNHAAGISLFDVRLGRLVWRTPLEPLTAENRVHAVGFAAESKEVFALTSKRMRWFDLPRGTPTRAVEAPFRVSPAFAGAPGGERVVQDYLQTRIWRTETDTLETVPEWLVGSGSASLALGSRGELVAASDGRRDVLVGRLDNDSIPISMEASAGARRLTFTRDSRRVAAIVDRRSVRVWNAENGKLLAVFDERESEIISLALSHDGHRVAVADKSGVVRVRDARRDAAVSQKFQLPRAKPMRVIRKRDREAIERGELRPATTLELEHFGPIDEPAEAEVPSVGKRK